MRRSERAGCAGSGARWRPDAAIIFPTSRPVMSRSELQQLLQQLRAELADAPLRDPRARDRLLATIDDIEQQLASADAGASEAAGRFADGVKESVEQFELEHPRVAALLNQLLLALSSMGI
jgi:hypothetical protein